MRTKLRSKVTLLFMMLGMLLAVPAVAFAADTIIADSDTVSTGDQSSRDLGVVGPGATVQVGVAPAKPQIDFYLDCNGNNHLNSGEQATIAFNSAGSSIRDASNVAPATGSLSATSLTNITGPASWPADNSGGNACQNFANAKLGSSEVTIVAPNSAGTYTYKVAYVTTRGTGTDPNELDTNVSNLPGQGTAADPDLVTFTLKVDATKPTITLTKPAEGDSYDVDESVTVDYSCQDEVGGSGIKSCAGDLADGATLDTSTPGSYTFTVNAEDKAGNTETVTHNYTVVNPDNTGPVITPNISGTLGDNGWYTSDVTLTWTVTDPESTVTSTDGCDRTDITADQQETTYTCTATSAGGQSSQSVSIKRDATDPTGVTTTLNRGPDHNGWYNAEVGWTTDGTDGTSGIASCDSGTYSGPDGTDLTVSGKCTDNAGNESDIVESAAFDYDNTDPALTPVVSPNPVQLNGSATVNANATDGTSGVDQASVSCGSVDASSVGSKSVSCSAADNAGNAKSASANYSVVYGSGFLGITQPINGGMGESIALTANSVGSGADPDFADDNSRFKLGSTVPVKFQLKDANGALVTDAVAKLNVKLADNKADPGIDETISTSAATTGNLFRYDATSGQYIFNLSTKGGYTNPNGSTITAFSQGTWTLSVMLADGTSRSVNIQLVR